MIEALIQADNFALLNIREFFFTDTPWLIGIISILADIEWIYMAFLLVGWWLIGTKKNDISYKITALNMFYIIAGTFIIYMFLNQFLPIRPRPEIVVDIPPLLKQLPNNSFPSGHAIFAAASWLAVHYSIRIRSLTLTTLLLGIIMNIARVISGVHYPGDIVVGYIVGVI